MSLDVYLSMPNEAERLPLIRGSGIFIRKNGATKENTREDWDERHPNREPIMVEPYERDDGSVTVYSANITHNLNTMAMEAGIYKVLWRPDEIGITKASQLIGPLTVGLTVLKNDPDHFKQFDSSNGWGTYPDFVRFVERYLRACEQFPDADISVSR